MWHGWDTRENSDSYEKDFRTEVILGILAKCIKGIKRIKLMGGENASEVEFLTTAWFDGRGTIKLFIV